MQTRKLVLKTTSLTLWTVILSALTGVLSAIPLRALRNLVGPVWYWLVMLVVLALLASFVWLPLAVGLGIQVLLIGIYGEFEDREFNLNQAVAYTLFLTTLLISSAVYSWVSLTGKDWLLKVTQWLDQTLLRMSELKITTISEIATEKIAQQMPAAVIIFIMISLAIGLIFEKPFARWMNVKSERRERLAEFQVPEVFIWVFILSLLGAFSHHDLKQLQIASQNILHVMLAAYFFQGLAVVFSYFWHFKVGPVWRFVWVLLFIQIPLILSLLGIVDFWMNLRKTFAKKSAEIKKRRIQE